MTRICRYCKKEVHVRARRCPHCKKKLYPKIIICEGCSREIRRTVKYCPYCQKLNQTFVDKVERYITNYNRGYRRRRYRRRLWRWSNEAILADLLIDIGINLAALFIAADPEPKPRRGRRRPYKHKSQKKRKGRYFAKPRRKKKMKYG